MKSDEALIDILCDIRDTCVETSWPDSTMVEYAKWMAEQAEHIIARYKNGDEIDRVSVSTFIKCFYNDILEFFGVF